MSAYNYQLIIKNLLEWGINRAPNKEVVYRDLVRYTWSQFYERIKRLANALEEIGVKRGTKVAVLDWDTHRYLELYFAVPMMGAILHTINLRLPPEHLLYTMKHAEDDVLVIRDEFLPIVERVKDMLPKSLKAFIITSDTGTFPETKLEPAYDYESLVKEASPDYEFPDLDENTDATLFYTSGTTGLPKGVIFTHRQITLHSLALGLASLFPGEFNLTSQDVVMPLVPFFHVHSWGMPYTAAFMGVKFVLPGRYEWDLILELMRKEGVTYTYGVPTILHALVYHPKAEEYRDVFSRLKMIIGGAALPRGLAKRARELGMKVISAYGLSETCPALTIAGYKEHMLEWPEDKKFEVTLKTGIPFPLVKVRVVNEKGEEVPKDGKTVGEIVVRAPWCTREYYKDPEKTKELWKDGWLHTGDVGVWDEDGYIQIVGRLKFVIKSGGEWISPLILEDLLSTHPAVSEVAVIPVPHEKWGERPIAVIVPKPEYKDKITEDEMRNFMLKLSEEGKVAKWWIPDRFIFVESLPKTGTGKIDVMKLIEQYKTLKLE
ncbi:MAG: long-chain fatty acid--CoA ligase [Candidatus Baldrarchaeia archaeon]